jgi:invasion protein IalB
MIKKQVIILFLSLSVLTACETMPEDFSWLSSVDQEADTQEADTQEAVTQVAEDASDKQADTVILKSASALKGDPLKSKPKATKSAKVTQKTFGDWIVHCIDGKDCSIVQQLRVKGGQLLLQLKVVPPRDNKPPVVTSVLPLGFYLPDQARMLFGEGSTYHLFIVQRCLAEGCIALASNSTRLFAAMKDGDKKAKIVMHNRDNREPINISFSRKGFSKAYDHLKSQ